VKIEQPEAFKDIRRNIMVAYQATDDAKIQSALRNALGALSRAVTPLDPEDSSQTIAELRGKLETFR
jgi:hypothetical protein